jgi:hypothetical protein
MCDVSQLKCRALVHREVEGIVAKGRAGLATGENVWRAPSLDLAGGFFEIPTREESCTANRRLTWPLGSGASNEKARRLACRIRVPCRWAPGFGDWPALVLFESLPRPFCHLH